MSHCLMITVSIPSVALGDVGALLQDAARLGDVTNAAIYGLEAMSMSASPVPVGATPPAEPTPKRTRAKKEPGGGGMPPAQPAVATNTGSDESGPPSLPPGDITVAATTDAGASNGIASAEPASVGNVDALFISVEELRALCAQAVQRDGAKRAVLAALLQEFGSESLSGLAPERRDDFHQRALVELA